MARKPATAKQVASTPEALELAYQLTELPTSQHKAGLAGLVLMVQFLLEQGEVAENDLKVVELSPSGVTLRFSEAGMNALFDEAYRTEMGEVGEAKIRKDRKKQPIPPLRIDTEPVVKKGKTTQQTKYFYPKLIPRGSFLRECDIGPGLWINLWRTMLWEIPRGIDATRAPYRERAAGKHCRDGSEKFRELSHSRDKSVELASTYFLGAQASTADGVPFEDSAARQFLLHFWPFATELFVPTTVTREGKAEFDGYVFVFPDIVNLEAYCDDYFGFLKSRSQDKRAYLPAAAVVDLPGEAGLRTMSWLSRLVEDRAQQGPTHGLASLLLAVDVVHARKDGNNVRILAQERFETSWVSNGWYRAIENAKLYSPVVRRRLLQNVLNNRPWYAEFARLLATQPSEVTFENYAFQHDARMIFELVKAAPADERNSTMTETPPELPMFVYRIAMRYLTGMLNEKYGLTWSDETKRNPGKYNEYKEKLAREALLAIRSRTGPAFVEYVATKIFSMAQGMPKEEFQVVSDALLNHSEVFRTLLMLALSAQMPRPSKAETHPE